MQFLTLDTIRGRRMNKEDLVVHYGMGGCTFDFALPQEWLDATSKKLAAVPEWKDRPENLRPWDNGELAAYDFIRSGTIWIYGEVDILGGPFYLSVDLQAWMGKLGMSNLQENNDGNG